MKDFKLSMAKTDARGPLIAAELHALDSIIAKFAPTISLNNYKSLVKYVGRGGQIFCPATFKEGVKSEETFEQAQLFALYFDNTRRTNTPISYYKAIDRAKDYHLPVLFSYDFYSLDYFDTIERFCLIFLLDTSVAELKSALAIQEALMTIFPEADKDSSVLKLYQGGNRILSWDKSMPTLDTEWLFMKMCLYLKDQYGPTNYKRKLIEFSQKTGVALNNKNFPSLSLSCTEDYLEDIDDKIMPKTSIEVGNSGNFLSTLKYTINFNDAQGQVEDLSTQRQSSVRSSFRSHDVDALSSTCKLYQEFISGDRLLSQRELLGLATNLTQAESGSKKFISTLKEHTYFCQGKEYESWRYHLFYLKNRDIMPCKTFCPHHDTCPHGKNILSTSKPKYHQIERIEDCAENLVTLDESSADFTENFVKAVMSDKQGWHIIKSQTSIGKTALILKFLKGYLGDVLLSVSTNDLKREECERAKDQELFIPVSPSLHELKDLLPEDVWDDIQARYDAGQSPMPLVNKVLAEKDERCDDLFKQYLGELLAFKASGTAITTHKRLTTMDVSKYDFVIVDEDIICSTIIPSHEDISISDLKHLKKKLAASDPLAAKIKKILKNIERLDYFILDDIEYDKSYADIKMAVNIPALCSAKHFCYREVADSESDLMENCVTFVKPIKFQENTKYIMLSATANKKICEYCFGEDNVTFYDCKEAENRGTLNQYCDKPMGRRSIRKDPSIFAKINKWTGIKNTISFKEFHKYYVGDLHFGNCSGYDSLKGKDINIIGTPHQPEWIYKLFAYSLGYDIDDKLKPNTVVEHNGFRFRFITYSNEVLRNIQFYLIESELEQAVGRARLLRCNCTVNLFSDFPLKQAVLKQSQYEAVDNSSLT